MPVLVGMILGAMLTVGAAFAYDTSTGRASNGLEPAAAGGNAPVVNWDVVKDNWHDVKARLENAGSDVDRGWKRITG